MLSLFKFSIFDVRTKNSDLMNKILLTFSIVLFTGFLSAQSIQLLDSQGNSINGQALTASGTVATTISTHVDARNNSNSSMDVLVKRQVLAGVSNHINWFRWEQVNGPSTSVSPDPVTLQAGETTSQFEADYNSSTAGVTAIRYVFYDQNNTSDSAWLIINFDAQVTSVPVNNSNVASVTNAYPNPATSQAAFNYHFTNNGTSKAVVYNLIGEKIAEYSLAKEGTLRIDLNTYDSGIYFCSFVNAGKTIATKRFTVK